MESAPEAPRLSQRQPHALLFHAEIDEETYGRLLQEIVEDRRIQAWTPLPEPDEVKKEEGS